MKTEINADAQKLVKQIANKDENANKTLVNLLKKKVIERIRDVKEED